MHGGPSLCFSIVWLGNLELHWFLKVSRPQVFVSLLFGLETLHSVGLLKGLQDPSLCFSIVWPGNLEFHCF